MKLEGCSVVALVYDVSNSESFANIEKWLDLYKRVCLNRATIGMYSFISFGIMEREIFINQSNLSIYLLGVLIGAKSDLEERAVIKSNQGQQLASNHGLEFFECSAVCIEYSSPA